MPPVVMYCLVSAISMNSRSTAEVTPSSTVGKRLSSVESVSISVSSKPLKIFAETSAPIVARKIAALRAPVKLLSSSAIAHSMAYGLRFLLHEPGADQLRGRFGLRRGKAERLLADVVPLAAQLEQLFRYERLRDTRHGLRRGRRAGAARHTLGILGHGERHLGKRTRLRASA